MGRRGRNVAAVAGLAATVILATGFFVAALNRVSQSSPGSPSTTPQIKWHSTQVPAQLGLGPFLAASGGRLYMVGIGKETSSRKVQVWSSADAAHWEQVANPGYEPDFVPRAAVAYGSDGLVVVGELTPSEAVVPQVWLSVDGNTFVKAQIPLPSAVSATGSGSGEIVAVATAAGELVAFGDHNIVDVTKSAEVRGLDSWHSADGSTWTHSDLAGSDGYSAISMTAWRGGFAALATQPGVDEGCGVWTSPDGIAWDRAGSIAAFGAVAIVALPHRLVVVGSKQDAKLGMVPASWSSVDGTSWTESAAPVSGLGAMFDAATVVGSSVMAIGVSHVGSASAAGVPSPSMPALVPPSIWLSNDGSTWQLLGAAPAFQPYLTSMAAFDGLVVVATNSGADVTVSVGDLAGATAAAPPT